MLEREVCRVLCPHIYKVTYIPGSKPVLAQYYAYTALIIRISDVMTILLNITISLRIFTMKCQYYRNIGFTVEIFATKRQHLYIG